MCFLADEMKEYVSQHFISVVLIVKLIPIILMQIFAGAVFNFVMDDRDQRIIEKIDSYFRTQITEVKWRPFLLDSNIFPS